MVIKESKTSLNIYYQNVDWMKSKFKEFKKKFKKNEKKYDVIVLTETNLQGKTDYVTFLESEGYTVFESQRNLDREGARKRGGGVLVAILNEYNPVRQEIMETDVVNLENVVVSLTVNNRRMNLFGVYIPPGSNAAYYDALYSSLITTNMLRPNDILTVIGDLNIPNIDWTPVFCTGCTDLIDATIAGKKCLGLMKLLGINQYNGVANDFGRMLDLVLSNQVFEVTRATDPFFAEEDYHPALIATMTLLGYTEDEEPITEDNFQKLYDLLKSKFAKYHWNRIFRKTNIDENVQDLKQDLQGKLDEIMDEKIRNALKLHIFRKIEKFCEYLRKKRNKEEGEKEEKENARNPHRLSFDTPITRFVVKTVVTAIGFRVGMLALNALFPGSGLFFGAARLGLKALGLV